MPNTKKSSSDGKTKLLIVEDERPLAHALELKFSHEGYDVTVAPNGKKALELMEENDFTAVLLDLIMPGMDGFTVMQEMNDRGLKSHVIILSNLGQTEDRERAEELGAKGYFVKSNTPITEIVKNVKSSI